MRFCAFLLLLCFALPFNAVVASAQQPQQKIIQWPPPPGKFIGPAVKSVDGELTSTEVVAVEIIEIIAGNKSVLIGQSFLAEEDWLKSFSVRMKNISDKAIVGARIDFSMPEAKHGESNLGSSLEYSIGAGSGKGLKEKREVLPGEEFVLTRSNEAYGQDQLFIKERSGVENISLVRLGLAWVKFADGTLWIGQASGRKGTASR